MDLEQYVTTAEAAEILGFSQDYVRELIREKRLEATKMGRQWLIHLEALDRIKPASRLRGRPKKSKN